MAHALPPALVLAWRSLSLASLGLGLSACALTANPASVADADLALAQLLATGRYREAEPLLARAVQNDLRNGPLQFLYALVQEQGAGEAAERRERAAVGYANALRFEPGHYHALQRLGTLELERGQIEAAQARFAAAVLDQPQRWEAFYGLGVAAYYRRDLPLLRLAAKRALTLAPTEPDVLRLAAFALAAEGDPAARELVRRAALDAEPAWAEQGLRRVNEYLSIPAEAVPPEAEAGLPAASPVADPTQVVVEVAILLSSVLDQKSRGLNLLDGLSLLYGYDNTLTQTADAAGRSTQRTITSAISVPQLNYSLNLFNDSGQYYSVVARPSITAHLGRESQFFAGRTVNVEVSGVNLGALQPIDVGVNLTVTPEAIHPDKVTFQLSAARSFLSQEEIGNFSNSLTTFRQSVSATADIAFGQTLVLSALSEQVSDKAFSKVPVLGDLPGVELLTQRSREARRQESLLILVTPTLPVTLDTPLDPGRRSAVVEQLLRTWTQRVEPTSDIPAILERLHKTPWLRAPERGDLRPRPAGQAAREQEAVRESLALWRG